MEYDKDYSANLTPMSLLKLIPITESLPEEGQDVIAWNGKRLVAAKFLRRPYVVPYIVSLEPYTTELRDVFEVEKYPSEGDRSLTNNWVGITHWMPAVIEQPK